MSLLQTIKELFTRRKARQSAQSSELTAFIYIKVPADIGPLDRGEKYEDPLELKLGEAGLGHVSGGGSQLSDKRSDGSQAIEFCGLDVEVTDLEKALVLLRTELPRLGIPEGTQLHYTIGDAKLQDAFERGSWVVAQARTFLHPGFGI